MIYSPGRNYIFIHIPKTGGTSLALALENRAMADDIMLGDTPKAKRRRGRVKDVQARGRLWKHSTLRDIEGLVTPDDIARARVFTLVRNPWDRMVSYYHWLRAQSFDHPAVAQAQRLNFSEFLTDRLTVEGMRRNPYASYVTDSAGVERCDLFLRLEHLEEDLAKLETLLDVRLAPISHENKSDREADYRSYYKDVDADAVAGFAADDIARFGYSFD
jgi:hypothetical protein